MMRPALAGILLSCVVAHPAFAWPAGRIAATATAVSDYRFRGISQSNRGFAPQFAIDWQHPEGWSAGAWTSTVDFQDHENTSLEVDFFAGKTFDLDGTRLAFDVFYYAYPDHRPRRGSPRYSSVEFFGEAGRSWGDLGLRATVAWSPEYFGHGPAWYLAGTVSYRLTDWLAASGTVGEQGVAGWGTAAGYPYRHWDAGFTATFGRIALDARYVTSDLSRDACVLTQGGRSWCSGALVASLSYRIELSGM
jgi:uncharacterized protein (TIGR02001 family)